MKVSSTAWLRAGAAVGVIVLGVGCEGVEESPSTTAAGVRVVEGGTASGESTGAAATSPTVVTGTLGSVPAEMRGNVTAYKKFLAGLTAKRAIAADDLVYVSTEQDTLGHTHLHFAQRKGGLEVVGGEVVVHADGSGEVVAVSGDARGDGAAADTSLPVVTGAEASRVAIGRRAGDLEATEAPRLVYVRGDSSNDGLLRAWEIEVEGNVDDEPVREKVYVDAQDGRIVRVDSLIAFALNRTVYDAKTRQTTPGTLVRSEGANAAADKVVNSSYDNLGDTYNCLKTLFERDSYDGRGAKLVSTVHYGRRYNNAFWNGRQMVYGDGDGRLLSNLAVSYDVTTHELMHAVTQSTANLRYSGESGALNEAMSDIIAATCEAWRAGRIESKTWLVGEDIYTPGQDGDALRYMDDPTADGVSTDYYPTRYKGYQDNGGVHINSGIANLAFKLLVTGGKHPQGSTTNTVPALGITKAGAIFYRALSTYMTSTTDFRGARAATVRAATDLYSGTESEAVHAAWDAVGVPR